MQALMSQPGARERIGKVGLNALSDQELLTLLLGTGGPGEGVQALAARLLMEAGGLVGLSRLGPGALQAISGLGLGKAGRILAAQELGRRMLSRPLASNHRLSSSRAVDEAFRPRLALAEREHFIAIPLDAKNRPIGELHVATGGLSACPVSPADVFRLLLREAAAAVVLLHNHPSGDPSPSPEDRVLTERLERAGALLGVPILDHVIIAREGYFSFLDHGLLVPSRP
ncbi:MAG: DNA repair protein RadC [Myxococcales bacterium]|nr:DNA repair protein RadC [Myxococcales bacterium]